MMILLLNDALGSVIKIMNRESSFSLQKIPLRRRYLVFHAVSCGPTATMVDSSSPKEEIVTFFGALAKSITRMTL